MDLTLVTAVVVGLVALWRLVELVRAPVPTRGRILVFALFAASFVSNASQVRGVREGIDAAAPGLAGLIGDSALVGYFVGFIVFFGAASPQRWFGAVRLQLTLAGTTVALLAAAWWSSLPTGNSLQYDDLSALTPPGPAAFSLVGNLYLGYAAILCAYLAALEATRSSRTGRVAFVLCSLGMALCLVGGPVLRVPATVMAATRTAMAPGEAGRILLAASQGVPGAPVLGVGILLVAVGLVLVALLTVAGKSVLWVRAKTHSLVVLPLWRDLVTAFPAIAEYPTDSAFAVLARVRNVRYRHERKLIECADGLWRLSPYVCEPDTDDDAALALDTQAALVRDAVDRYRRGSPPLAAPVAIAAPASGDSEGALLLLARAYSRVRAGDAGLQQQAS